MKWDGVVGAGGYAAQWTYYRRPRTGVSREINVMYKEFAAEAVVWLVPVVVLIGLALMVTS